MNTCSHLPLGLELDLVALIGKEGSLVDFSDLCVFEDLLNDRAKRQPIYLVQ